MAASCPSCRRPVAVPRARCLYCGAPLPGEAVAAAERARAELEAPVPPSPTRTLLVVDWNGAPAGPALDLSAFDVAQRRRGGECRLEGVLAAEDAAVEAERLRSAGHTVFLVPEAAARAAPWVASGGTPEADGLRLRGEGGVRRLAAADLLLVVRGPIAREYRARPERRKVETAGLEPGYRFHLHVVSAAPTVELDPGEFDFRESGRQGGSSLLEMSGWVLALAGGRPVDDGFRRLPPALAPAGPAAHGGTRPGLLAPSVRGAREGALVLDNLAQFRFYSAWRAAVERLRGAPPDGDEARGDGA